MKSFIVFLFVVSAMLLSGCVNDAPYKFPGDARPEQLQDGWAVAPPESVGINPADLNRIYARLYSESEYFNALGFLVVKDGYLIFETYVRDPGDRDHFTHVASTTKSITSLLFGTLLFDGTVDSLDQTLYSIMPDKFPADAAKRFITLRHLLTMTSGILLDNDDFSVDLFVNKPADPEKYFLAKPLYASPGTKYYYRDVDPQLISASLQRLTGTTEEQLARERLFTPLGITDYYWVSDHRGTTSGAIGLHVRPRDMAKIGQMVLDHGRWKGAQVVDSSWIALSTRKQVGAGIQDAPDDFDYGFYWWILPQRQAFSALGHGGNFIFVLPSKNLVVVMTSMADAGEDAGTTLGEFEDLISPLLN